MPQLSIEQALQLAKQHHQAGRLREAESLCRQILSEQPRSADAIYMLGAVAYQGGNLDGGIAAFRQAIALRPELADAHGYLGLALEDAGQVDEALQQYRLAETLGSDARMAENYICTLYFHPDYDARQIYEAHVRWNQTYARPSPGDVVPCENDRDPQAGSGAAGSRRLRIGYVSPDFRQHVVGYNMVPLFREHDHSRFEIFCYSNVRLSDSLTDSFRSRADGWRDITPLDGRQAADLIRADRIDILVDLALHLRGNRLRVLARKPAPVQVTFAGYPGTTGMDAIDYRLSDPYLDPIGLDEAFYAEKTIRLPHSFWCYDPPTDQPPVNELPALSNGFVTFGCLNNFAKINPGVLKLWSRVLRETPGSHLLLLSKPGSHRQRTADFLAAEGVEPGRLQFVASQPRVQYLQTYHRIDIGLDSFPYNGHTTSLDSYWMGVPVITRIGRTIVGRAGWSQLSNLGLTDLAARDDEQFVRIAIELVADLPKLASLRSTLRARMRGSPLMDAKAFARGIEDAYRSMWRKWCA